MISGNTGDGVDITDSGTTGNVVAGNFIGTNAAGSAVVANSGVGVGVFSGAADNMIGGTTSGADNVISGNDYGVFIQNSGTGNVVQGNRIGTDVSGTVALGNAHNDLTIYQSSSTTIGGTAAGAGNVISGALFGQGVDIDQFATDTLVQGNLIGTDSTGKVALGNHFDGVFIGSGSNNTIGGAATGAGNVISGNSVYGVFLDNFGTDNLIQGNLIGTKITGDVALGNGTAGIALYSLLPYTGTTIGGTVAGAGNVISGNAKYGIDLQNSGASGTTIVGNKIGTDSTGTLAVPNATGVNIEAGASDTTVGGTTAGAGNVISGNSSIGITVFSNDNLIAGNRLGTDFTGTAPWATCSASTSLGARATRSAAPSRRPPTSSRAIAATASTITARLT